MNQPWGRLGAAEGSSSWESYLTIAQAVSDPEKRLQIWTQRRALLSALGAPPIVMQRVDAEIASAQKAISDRQTALVAADQWNVGGQVVIVSVVAVAGALIYYLLRRA